MKEVHTALISSLRTPIRLSRAARTPFRILTILRAIKLFKGHPTSKTIKPANALRPSNLDESDENLNENWNNVPTDWYKNRPPIRISKGAKEEYEYHVDEVGETELYIRTSIENIN